MRPKRDDDILLDGDNLEIVPLEEHGLNYAQGYGTYSHELLVMRAYQKVQDTLNKEMIKGHYNIVTDAKGKEIVVYKLDTRKEAIEAIKTLKNTMIADIKNTPHQKKINELFDKVKTNFNMHVEQQSKWFNSLDKQSQQNFYSSYPDLYFCLMDNLLV